MSGSRCPQCQSVLINYTKIGGGKRANCCDHNVHFNDCEHGDCSCQCHVLVSSDTVRTINELKQLLNDDFPFLNNSPRDWFATIHSILNSENIPEWAIREWPDLKK